MPTNHGLSRLPRKRLPANRAGNTSQGKYTANRKCGSDSLEQAARYADQAANLYSSLPQVHFVIGQIRLFQRRHAEAVAAVERAIEVNPNYADAFALLAWTLNYAGQPEKAVLALNMAMRLNPRPPASYLEILGKIYFTQGRYNAMPFS